MFKYISHRIALQFTTFVFLLLLLNGLVFLIADYHNGRRMAHDRLVRSSNEIREPAIMKIKGMPTGMPPPMMERIRIMDSSGHVISAGNFFSEIPFERKMGFSSLELEDEDYVIFTAQLREGKDTVGYVQIVGPERQQYRDLPIRALLYLIVSVLISAATYLVGIVFARHSLQPAEEMMERLEQFTQDASHELRTPLATLNSSLDLALRTKKYQEGLESAKADVKQIEVLVERLLELTRLDALDMTRTPVDLSVLTEQTVSKHKLLAKEKGATISADVAPGVHVQGDGALIHQVLSNLLTNAVKFGRPHGSVHVTLKKDSLSVSDDGIGMDAEDVPHVFDRFYQADASRSRGGLGLGLALVKRIVDLHGWNIAVSSQKNKGTTFTIHFAKAKIKKS